MTLTLSFASFLVGLVSLATVPLTCDHQGLYACTECSSGSCTACIDGWYLLSSSVGHLVIQDGPSLCVPDCEASPLFFNDPVLGECSKCPVSLAGQVCVNCYHGVCHEEVTQAEYNTSLGSTCVNGEIAIGADCGYFCSEGEYYDFSSAQCLACHQNCRSCLGPSQAQCTSCGSGFFLSSLNSATQFGECSAKAQTSNDIIELFVTNNISVINDGKQDQSRSGSELDPFTNLLDAIRKADQLAAPSSGQDVTISLTPGVHFILPSTIKSSYLQDGTKDAGDRDYSLTIKALECPTPNFHFLCNGSTESVTVVNKAGAFFKLSVPRSLTLKNIAFDSADSHAESAQGTNFDCNARRETLCQFNSVTRSFTSLSDCECPLAKMSANNCIFPVPNAFIQFDYNSAVASLDAPKQLLIEGCEFRHNFDTYYNLIEVPSIGANITLIETQFHHISSCGAVIGNIETEQIDFPSNSAYLVAVKDFMERRYAGEWSRNGADVISNYDPMTQSQIKIEQSTFSQLDFLFDDDQDGLRMEFDYATYSHYIRANSILLYKTDIPLTLYNNTFQENRFNIGELLNTTQAVTIPSGALYSSRSGVMIESMIYLFRIKAQVQLVSNYIAHNGGTKGPIVIELEFQDPNALTIIANNEFEFNSGIVSSGALSLFSGVNSGALSTSGTFCGGFVIKGNSFVGNSVMRKGGIIRHECSRSDISFLNYDVFHQYYSQSPVAQEKWQDWALLSYSFQSASKTSSVPSGETITFNPLIVEIINNKFEMNLRGTESSVFKLDRTPFFSIRDNLYQANGDILVAGLASSLDQFVSMATGLRGVKALGSQFQLGSRGSSLPLIYSTLSVYFQFKNITADDNWMYSQQSPKTESCASFLQTKYQASQVVLLDTISVTNTQLINQQPYSAFFSLRQISLDTSSTYLWSLDSNEKLSCSMVLFNLAQENAQMSLSKLTLSDQYYETRGSQSALISILPFNYDSFQSTSAVGNSQVLFTELFVTGIECTSDCSILSSLTDAISLLHSSFSNIIFHGQGNLISLSISQDMSATYINTTAIAINAAQSSSLFQIQQNGASSAMVTFGGLLVSNVILNETLFYISGPQLTFTMDSFLVTGLSYEQTNPSTDQGLFHLNSLGTFVMQNTNLQVQTRAEIGNYFLKVDSITQLLMQSCNFEVIDDSTSPISFMDITLPQPQSIATFSKSSFKGMKTNSNGGVLSVSGQGSLYLSQIEMSGSEAQIGGAMFIDEQVNAFISQSTFTYNNASIIAGCFYASHTTATKVQDSEFSYNHAPDAGVFYVTMGANVQFLRTEFSYNSCEKFSGVGLILNNEATQPNYFVGCTVKYTRSQSSAFYLFFAQVIVDSSLFIDNYCPDEVAVFAIAQSALSISNSRFENTLNFLEQEYGDQSGWPSTSIQGFFINFYLNGLGSITNSIFRNGIGKEGAAIAFSDRCQVQVKFCTFENHYGDKGAIFAQNSKQGQISDNSFINGVGEYSDIYFNRNNDPILVSNNILQYSGSSSMMMRKGKYVLNNNTFYSLSNSGAQMMMVEKNYEITLTANQFLNSNADRAIYFTINTFTSTTPAIVAYNVISHITGSSNGIGMHLQNSPNMVIQNNQFNQIEFTSLEGSQEAAGIYVDEKSTNVMLNGNSFRRCKASIGGAVSFKNGFVFFSNNLYSQNEGSLYGQDVAAYPVSLSLKQYDELPQVYKDRFPRGLQQGRNLQTLMSVRSGGSIDGFYLVLLDQYGDVVVSSSGNPITLEIQNLVEAAYLPKAESIFDIEEKHGVYDLSVVTFSGEPGKNTKLTVISSAIDPSLSGQVSYAFQVELNFRNCVAGEEYTDDGRCIPCTAGFYSSEAPQAVSACEKCPANAECFGGTSIAPLPGYWRSSTTSLNFISCYISSACLGSTADDVNPLGKCYDGYQGILCAQCEQGYVRNAQFQCAKCPAQWKNILLLVLILAVAILVIILLIRTTLQSMKNHRSIVSVYFKILANHFQLIILTISFELEWPAQVQTFYDITQPVADVSSRIISLDCFLGTDSQGMNNIYIYLLVYLMLPIIAISGTLFFWFLYIRGNKKKAFNRSITTVIILFFLLHPSLTKNVFNIFFCRNIDGTSRLIQDLEIECYTGEHLYWAVVGGGFGLVLWVVGIPWVAWALLRQHRNRLHNQEVKERYGFLFNGYKQRTYYWESVVMFRKVAMIFIAVFLRSLGTRIQAFTVFLLLLFFVIATVEKKPYLTRKLNSLELVSLVTSCITIYSGFFFLSATEETEPSFDSNKDFSLSPEGKWLFFLIILFSNMFFILMWTFALIKELRGVCRARFPRFYLCFCLCHKAHLLEEEKRNSKAFEANENVVDQIDNIMLVMKKARHKVVDRDIFVDWNKFMTFIHSSSQHMAKLNLEKPIEGDERRRSDDNYRMKRIIHQDVSKDASLDISAENDFDLSQKSDNLDIEFQEVEQPSMNTSYMTSGTELKKKYTYQRTRFHERVSSISGLTSFNSQNDSLSHRNIPEEDEEQLKTENEEEPKSNMLSLPPIEGGKKNKLKEIAASLLGVPAGQVSSTTLSIPVADRQKERQLNDSLEEREQNQSILDFFESKDQEAGGPAVYYTPPTQKPRRKSIRRDPSELTPRNQSKRSKRASMKYEIKRMPTSLKSQESTPQHNQVGNKRIVTANTLKSIDLGDQEDNAFHKQILQNIELPMEIGSQAHSEEIKETQATFQKNEELPAQPQREEETKLEKSSSIESLGSCGSSCDLKINTPQMMKRRVTYSSFRNASKKVKTQDSEKLNLVDSFMNGLDEAPL